MYINRDQPLYSHSALHHKQTSIQHEDAHRYCPCLPGLQCQVLISVKKFGNPAINGSKEISKKGGGFLPPPPLSF